MGFITYNTWKLQNVPGARERERDRMLMGLEFCFIGVERGGLVFHELSLY